MNAIVWFLSGWALGIVTWAFVSSWHDEQLYRKGEEARLAEMFPDEELRAEMGRGRYLLLRESTRGKSYPLPKERRP